MADSITATQAATQREADIDERSLHRKVQWFTEKWTTALDLNKRDAAEFSADFVAVIQAVHRDANRETHNLLTKALMAMPPAPIFIPKSGT
jgi:hypothetical protein